MSEPVIILTTFPDMEAAEGFAHELITNQLAACVNILPRMISIYEWEGKHERGQEHQLVIKTIDRHFAAIEQRLKNSHSYELPELLMLPAVSGSTDYLNWIHESTNDD